MTGAGTWLRRIVDRRNTAAGEPEGAWYEHVRNGSSIAVGDALAWGAARGSRRGTRDDHLTMREQIEQTPDMHLTGSVLDASFDDALPERRKAMETTAGRPTFSMRALYANVSAGFTVAVMGRRRSDRWLPGSPLSLEEDARGM